MLLCYAACVMDEFPASSCLLSFRLPLGPQDFPAPASWLDLLLAWAEMGELGGHRFARGGETRAR